MEWYNQILKENAALADAHDLATTHVSYWVNYAQSDFSTKSETLFIISFAITALIALFFIWTIWRMISSLFRKKQPKDSTLSNFTVMKPETFRRWPKATQDSYVQAEIFLAQQVQLGTDSALESLQALSASDTSKAIQLLGTVRDKAQMEGNTDQQLEMIRLTSSLYFGHDISAAKQTIDHGLALNPQDPLTLLLNGDIALHQKNGKEAFASYTQGLKYAREQKNAKAEIFALSTLAEIATLQKNIPQAQTYLTDSLTLSTTMMKQKKAENSWTKMAINSHLKLGKIQLLQQNFDKTNHHYAAGLALQQKFVAQNNKDISHQRDLTLMHIQIGEGFAIQKDLDQAQLSFQQAVANSKNVWDQQPDLIALKRDYALALSKSGQNQTLKNDKEAALQSFSTSLTLRQEMVADAGEKPSLLHDLAIGHERLGDFYRGEKDLNQASHHYHEAYLSSDKTMKANPNNLLYAEDVTRYLSRISYIQASTGKTKEAITTLSKVLQIKENLVQKLPNNLKLKLSLTNSYLLMSKIDKAQNTTLLTKILAILTPLSDQLPKEQKMLMASIQKELQTRTSPQPVAQTQTSSA